MFSNAQPCNTAFTSSDALKLFICLNVCQVCRSFLKHSLNGKKSVFLRSTSHVGYVKSIQQSASAVAEYPHAFDSTLQSERLHSQSTHYSSHKKSQSSLITLDPTFPHLGDVVSDLSH